MPALVADREGSLADAAGYERHRAKQALLYQVVDQHYPAFRTELEGQRHTLPNYVQRVFQIDIERCECSGGRARLIS